MQGLETASPLAQRGLDRGTKGCGVAYSRTCSGLLNGSLGQVAGHASSGPSQPCGARLRDETCVERARSGFDNYARVGADVGDVGNGPCGRCDLHAETVGHFISAQRYGCRVQLDGGRSLCGAWSALPRQRQMDFVRTRRRQLVQSERSIVRDHGTTWRESSQAAMMSSCESAGTPTIR